MPTAECSFEYLRQPPSTTLDGCDPYTSSNRVSISLDCAIRRRAMVTDEFEVRWFRENTAGAVEDLGLGHPDQMLGMDWLSRYHNTAFFNQPYSPSLLGKYWCQVINTTADPDQPLMRSNVFTLLAPEDYSGSHCAGSALLLFVDNQTCADLPDNQLPVQSATYLPPTTELQIQASTAFAVSSSYHTTQLLISTELFPSTITTSITTALPTPDDSTTITPALSTPADSPTITLALPTPADSPTITPALSTAPVTSVIVYVVSGVSGGVLLVTILICCSGVILVLVKRRRKTALATSGQPVYIRYCVIITIHVVGVQVMTATH